MRHDPHLVLKKKRRRAFMRGGAVMCQSAEHS
jgi:hypothetical protein